MHVWHIVTAQYTVHSSRNLSGACCYHICLSLPYFSHFSSWAVWLPPHSSGWNVITEPTQTTTGHCSLIFPPSLEHFFGALCTPGSLSSSSLCPDAVPFSCLLSGGCTQSQLQLSLCFILSWFSSCTRVCSTVTHTHAVHLHFHVAASVSFQICETSCCGICLPGSSLLPPASV